MAPSRSPRTDPPRDAFRRLARLGYLVNGILHVLIGGIAIGVALGAGSTEADQSGALGQLAATPGGLAVLWIITIGLAALGIWEIVHGLIAPRPADRRWTMRLAAGGKALAYLAVAATAFTFARGGSSSSSQTATTFSARLLGAPGGVVLLVVIGLVIAAIGVFFAGRGITRGFRRDIRVPAGAVGRATVGIGVVGYLAKGIAVTVVGILVVVAAVTFDPSKASGLDAALKALAGLPFGAVVLVVVGLGLIAYGVYSGLRARYALLR